MEATKLFPVAPAMPQVDYVGKTHLVQPPHVLPTANGAAKAQPLGHPKRPHAITPLPLATA